MTTTSTAGHASNPDRTDAGGPPTERVLLTGATGNVGRPLIDLLGARGVAVRAVSRHRIAAPSAPHLDVVEGDPSHPETLASALDGVTSLFLNPRSIGGRAAELLALAKVRGVRRAVALSAINVDDDPTRQPSRYRGDLNREVEDAVTSSGLEWVSLRPSVFATNTIGLWAAQIQHGDVVRGPYAASVSAPIDERDIAGVAAHALVTDDLLGQRLDLTGPQSLTPPDMVAAIADAIGRNLHYQEIPPQAAKTHMVDAGFPAQFAEAFLSMQAATVGRPALLTNEVEKILGRPALTYARWAVDHTGVFRAPA